MPLRFASRTWPALLCALGLLGILASCGSARPAAPATIASAAAKCNKIAAPYGNDHRGSGSHRHPFRTLRRLDRALRPGQTGCLRTGTYGGFHTWHPLSKDGTARRRITLRAYPGEHVKLVGWIQLTGSYTTLSHFVIDGSNTLSTGGSSGGGCPRPGVSEGLSIEGHNDVFEHNNLYQSRPDLRGNGIGIGWSGSGTGTVIRYNKIHDVGQCRALDHLIYLAHGSFVQIYDNWLWNDPHGWGVQLYPGSFGAHVFSNVIDSAGSGFTVGGDPATSDNTIDHNVVINSTGLPNAGLRGVAISDYWPSTAGTGNSFVYNDSYRNPQGIMATTSAIKHFKNLSVYPQFVDAAAHNYALSPSSPLKSWGLWNGP
jgi:hypothetical protein